MNNSSKDYHIVQNILDTHVILDGEVKEEIVIQEKNNYIKNDYLPTDMTANVNVEEVRLKKLSIDETGGDKAVQLNIGEDIEG